MGKHQCNNIFNNLKSNLVPPEPCSPRTEKPRHPKPEKAEEIELSVKENIRGNNVITQKSRKFGTQLKDQTQE